MAKPVHETESCVFAMSLVMLSPSILFFFYFECLHTGQDEKHLYDCNGNRTRDLLAQLKKRIGLASHEGIRFHSHRGHVVFRLVRGIDVHEKGRAVARA